MTSQLTLTNMNTITELCTVSNAYKLTSFECDLLATTLKFHCGINIDQIPSCNCAEFIILLLKIESNLKNSYLSNTQIKYRKISIKKIIKKFMNSINWNEIENDIKKLTE